MADVQRSHYERLEHPVFKSSIPPHLISKLSDSEKFVVDAVSRLEAQNDWLTHVAVENRRELADIDERVQVIQDWKTAIGSKWALIAAALVICLPVMAKAIMDRLWKP